MSLWEKYGEILYRIDPPIEYRGHKLLATDRVGIYIEKWLVRHKYKYNSNIYMYNETETTVEITQTKYSIEKYGIRRTIQCPPTLDNINLYLNTFNQYIETLRELRELKTHLG